MLKDVSKINDNFFIVIEIAAMTDEIEALKNQLSHALHELGVLKGEIEHPAVKEINELKAEKQ